MKAWVVAPLMLLAGSAFAQPFLFPLQQQPQREAAPTPPSPMPIAPPQAGPSVQADPPPASAPPSPPSGEGAGAAQPVPEVVAPAAK